MKRTHRRLVQLFVSYLGTAEPSCCWRQSARKSADDFFLCRVLCVGRPVAGSTGVASDEDVAAEVASVAEDPSADVKEVGTGGAMSVMLGEGRLRRAS
ncbi:hypothetical protein B0H17DRAFT_1097136 [Mycena rosella]|uniref:Secreted protein n=1 Tax=Mycena rosella TaxID=1033263 RepID=A0AAD7CQG3_MYCRO|nr:hypothetical protein B0H17DRAFT_1097136 [Mycena rosella]